VDLHVSSFNDGDLYTASALEDGDLSSPLPQYIQPTPEDVANLSKLTADYIDLSGGHVMVQSERVCMPRTAHARPVMAKVLWNLLF